MNNGDFVCISVEIKLPLVNSWVFVFLTGKGDDWVLGSLQGKSLRYKMILE